ncbi:hypothetical protein MLD38_032989 [Melastoma candidum]|uniref:Uncharacterized protein n=1 Tax=Melastoma candidum TaxID=119954 RepID=A0ACB9M5R9_9MYRT|nr:hypothetical protein MLD38_032989 [Melastoma candidum]
MASSNSIAPSLTILLVVLALSLNPCLGDGNAGAVLAMCSDVPDPSYCQSLVGRSGFGKDIHDYGRSFIGRSLSRSHRFIETVEKFLEEFLFLPTPTVRALKECRSLSGTNAAFLTTSSEVVNATTGETISESRAVDVHTWLSAVLTNQQTCLDGLQEVSPHWNIWEAIFVPLYDDLKLFGVCLSLFIKGWVNGKGPGSPPNSHQAGPEHGRLILKMSSQTKAIYDSIHHHRRLLQADEQNPILISNILVVSQDGTSNCTNITSAVNLAPNNTDGTSGYFLIYVTAGVYQEYVSIPSYKNYLIMIGDGINQTVVTGNRSVVDGWTTFGSATFSKILNLTHSSI